MTSAGGVTHAPLVSLAEGVVDADEIFALIRKPEKPASRIHSGSSANLRRRRPSTPGYEPVPGADYEGPALAAIRPATAIVARTAPAQLSGVRAFLAEIAGVVADANREGGFFGLGARRRTPNEAAAMDAVPGGDGA